MGYSIVSIRKVLEMNNIDITPQTESYNKQLLRKINSYREHGLSYQKIADKLNLLKVATISGKGQWYAKRVRKMFI